jgi:hypothetical protein
LTFSKIRGTAKNHVGWTSASTSAILRGSSAQVTSPGERDRQVVVGGPLGDVRVGQPRDDAEARLELDELLEPGDRRHEVRVGELDALRVAGRARRVDEREQVVAADLRRRRPGVEARVPVALDVLQAQRALAPVPVDDDHVLERRQPVARGEELIGERLVDDREARLRVADDELDLLGRRREVDRERRRADGHHGEVGQVELGPVAEHERDVLAAAQPELREAGGQRVGAGAHLAPGDLHRPSAGAERDAVRVVAGGAVERLDEVRRRRLRGRRSGRLRGGAALHVLSLSSGQAPEAGS